MNLLDIIKLVSEKFVYTSDKIDILVKDNWYIMSEKDGKFHGDCEDYALTIMYLFAGGYLKMFWKLLTGEFKLHFTMSNGTKIDHCVGSIGDVWFDNWTLDGNSREKFFEQTRQVYGKKISVFVIFSKLLTGKLFGKK